MEFNFLNFTGALIVALMLIPNITCGSKNKFPKNRVNNRFIILVEQVGRYGSIALMVFPIMCKNWEFGFSSADSLLIWFILCSALFILYFMFWALYFKQRTLVSGLVLAIVPSMIFILRGVFLSHLLLIIFGAAFAAAHIYITYENHRRA